MDEVSTVKELAAYLTPFLPYLVEAGKYAAGAAAKKFGESAWNGATALWQRLWPKVQERPLLKAAFDDVINSAEDEDVQAALRVQLRKVLLEDGALAKELAQILSELKDSGVHVEASGDRSVAAGRDITNSTINTGDTYQKS